MLYSVKRLAGFTLIELMIAVAVVGILAAIVYPSYTAQVAMNTRSEGQRELIRLSQLMEQYFLDHRSYTEDMTDLGMSVDPFETENGHYKIDAVPVSSIATDFRLVATAQGAQAARDSGCTTLTLDYLGSKGPVDCW
ncbi:type IV pilin protein [Corallincola holothuriorum]|uniref:Type IV pilin protein n=2 Tax=Corallincola holothuriorum TaxID=2282215 RepID=A0A368N6U2_9GAMM|nr:type IV pilin protein [Corallincola holothuriorum]